MQRTKSKLLSILLSLVMLLSLLPTTALAATYADVEVNNVTLSNGQYLESNSADTAISSGAVPSSYVAWYKDGVLTLNGYKGKGIAVGGALRADITVKLVGTNTIKDGDLKSPKGGDITITSDSKGTLSITKTISDSNNSVIGIQTGLASGLTTGNVTIKGDAKVTINVTHNGTNGYDNAYGIYAKENITISEDASVDITCATPNNTTGGYNCNGLVASKKVIIDTNGEIKINVKNAGGDDAYSYGIFPTNGATLTKVGNMEVKWKKHASVSLNSGGVITGSESFSDTDHAINVDKPNCYASYRYGTPRTVMVKNGTLTGPGVLNAKSSGKFLENDTVSITPYERKGKSGEDIPFKGWTSSDVTLSSPTTAANSFTVPNKDVTVTAKHDPFDGTPTFTPTGTTNTTGTLTFKTKVKLGDGTECFYLAKDGEQNDESKYISFRTDNSPSTSPYEYNYETRTLPGVNQVDEGDYYVVELLNGSYYLSDKFTVSYTAAPTPTANISLDKTGTVDFGSMEAGYTTAPTAETVTITNNGTAATGALIIALDGANKTNFTLSKTSITDIASGGGTDTFTVQPKTGLSAGIYTATVKVSGTGTGAGVTEQRFDVKFTVTAAATPIAVPTAITGLVYDGTEKTGVSAGTGYTLGGDYEATNVGATDYTATATLDTGYKWTDGSTGVKTITWNIGKRTPTATDFTFAPPTDLTYDGNNKTASFTLNSPFTNSGAITVKYEKDGASVTETKDVGEYTVKIDVAGGGNFTTVSDLNNPAWKFSITPADQSAPTGLGVAAPTTSSGNGKITGTTTAMEYSTDSGFTSPAGATCTDTATEVAPGTYYVRFKADANHNAGAVSAALVVPAYSATKYTVTVTSDANGTAGADKTANVAAGETVTLTATPNSGYVFDKWDNKTPAGLTIGADGKFTMPGENVSVKAIFKGATLTGMASITGDLKYGQELTASLASTNNTGTLTYKWYRSGETAEIETNTTGKYTLVAADIGKTITVKITSSVQTGEITSAATAAVVKADGPAAPSAFTLSFTLNSDGTTFTATIPTVAGGEYSFDGTNYSATNTKANCAANTSYTGHVRIAATSTHKASASTSSTQTSPKLTVATPTFTPNGASSFTGTQSVTISCTTAGAKIYYTTDGTTPTASSTEYTTALSLTSTTTVKAIAVKTGMNDSAIATATFTKYSGGGGGGGGSYTPSYTISVDKTENGTITVSPKSASKGDTVTITVKPDKGYELEMLKVLDKDGDALKLTEKNGKYSFKMPAGKVEVKATFIKEAEISPFDDVSTNAYYYEAVKWAQEKGITGGIGNKLFGPNEPCTRAQIVTFLWRAAGSPAPKNTGTAFGDVKPGSFYEQAVAWAVENGITGGTSDGMFSPDATCTRAQSVTFLYRAAGSPAVSGSAEFGDVATNAYYADAVAWAAKNGITGGIGGGLFGSNNDCTRAQIVTFLYRNYQSK